MENIERDVIVPNSEENAQKCLCPQSQYTTNV